MKRHASRAVDLPRICLAAMLAGASIVAGPGAALAKPQVAPNVPTRANFGVVFHREPMASFTSKHGLLSCVGLGLTDCTVTNMPLIGQGADAGLKTALTTYVQKYVVGLGRNGKVVWSEPQLGIGPTPLSPTDFAQRILDNGCYIASLTTIENTLFADLGAAQPKNRAAQLNTIGVNSLYTGTKPYNQLLWQYERWADRLQPNKADSTQPSPTDFLEFPEFAGDFTPAAPTATPSIDDLSDASVIEAMKQDKLTLIEYQRYTPTAAFSPADGTYTVTLTNFGQHKVVVSGFKPGTFELTINDVGDGQSHRVHITRSLSDLSWSFITKPGQRPKVVAASAVSFPSDLAGKPILVYESEDRITLNDPNAQIIIIDATDELGRPPQPQVKPPLPCGPKVPCPVKPIKPGLPGPQ